MDSTVSSPVEQTGMPIPPTDAVQANVSDYTVPDLSGPSAAVDAELIEPEWVNAVKRIMAQHRDDPYTLAQAMIALREDYLVKRYSRHIEPVS